MWVNLCPLRLRGLTIVFYTLSHEDPYLIITELKKYFTSLIKTHKCADKYFNCSERIICMTDDIDSKDELTDLKASLEKLIRAIIREVQEEENDEDQFCA